MTSRTTEPLLYVAIWPQSGPLGDGATAAEGDATADPPMLDDTGDETDAPAEVPTAEPAAAPAEEPAAAPAFEEDAPPQAPSSGITVAAVRATPIWERRRPAREIDTVAVSSPRFSVR